MNRAAIENEIAKAQVSIASAETAAEEESVRGEPPEARNQSDGLVELLIARMLRVSYRDNLLRELSVRFARRLQGRQ